MEKAIHCLVLLSLAISSPSISSSSRTGLQNPVSMAMVMAKTSNRRILHQPLYPIGNSPEINSPFFPQTPPPPPPEPDPDQQNITPSPTISINPVPPTRPKVNPIKKIAILSSVSIAVLLFILALAFLLYRRRIWYTAESNEVAGNDSGMFPSSTSNSLYLGTVHPSNRVARDSNRSPYHRLNRVHGAEVHCPSPELHPLPPLTGEGRRISSSDMSSDVETLFYSPQGSIEQNNDSSYSASTRQSLRKQTSRTFARGVVCGSNCSTSHRAPPEISISIKFPSSPSPPLPSQLSCLQQSQLQSTWTETMSPAKKNAQLQSPYSPNRVLTPVSVKSSSLFEEKRSSMPPKPPPPPPLPAILGKTMPSENCESSMPVHTSSRPQPHMPATATTTQDEMLIPVVKANDNGCSVEPLKRVDSHESAKPRLKPLHWDKLRASSDHAMVWDQLKTSNFQLNEDMIETLFVSSTSKNPVQKEASRKSFLPQVNKEGRVLDPKKSQNMAIILRALNVTLEEVSEALLDGNTEGLGAELLETLVKMAPTKEEELKLKSYNGDISKLGSAERFLKAVLDIPFAFKRVDAMLYRANFDIEVKYLRKSYETLEVACRELKNSRLFLKLLEAVLRTGNRMNVGTNHGEAKAFRLDTLLKLVDIKGTDGKTTLLHFVVQEIIRSEALDSDIIRQTQHKEKDDELKKQGLQVVAALRTELENVRKAAGIDPNVLRSYLSKLITGLEKTKLALQPEKSSIQEGKFFESMNLFLKESEDEIVRIKAEETTAFSHVKETTEYFHGDSVKEEAHPFRIFMIVRDFLLALDQVCKEVGRMHDRTIVGSVRSFQLPADASSLPVFNRFNRRQDRTSSDEDSSSSL